MTRRGFTVVEVLVAMALGVVALLLVWRLYGGESRRFDVDQNRLAALEAGVLLDEHLAQDLDRIAVEYAGEPGDPFTVDEPLRLADAGRGLELRVYAGGDASTLDVSAERVRYRRDSASGEVVRESRGRTTRFPGLVAEHLQFSVITTPLTPPAPVLPGDSSPGRLAPLTYVKYVLACITPEMRARPAAARPPEARITMVGAFPLVLQSQRLHHSYWRPARIELLGAP